MLGSGLSGGQYMNGSAPCVCFLSRHSMLLRDRQCWGSLSCWKIKFSLIQHFPHGIPWWIKIWQYFPLFTVSSVLIRSPPFAEMQILSVIDSRRHWPRDVLTVTWTTNLNFRFITPQDVFTLIFLSCLWVVWHFLFFPLNNGFFWLQRLVRTAV